MIWSTTWGKFPHFTGFFSGNVPYSLSLLYSEWITSTIYFNANTLPHSTNQIYLLVSILYLQIFGKDLSNNCIIGKSTLKEIFFRALPELQIRAGVFPAPPFSGNAQKKVFFLRELFPLSQKQLLVWFVVCKDWPIGHQLLSFPFSSCSCLLFFLLIFKLSVHLLL